jgi:alkylation response protein AidB-like acyl-CoA dehydrogenase
MNDGREELDDLREAVREFLAAKSPETAVRAAMETGHDPAVWDQMARQLQLPGLALPADYGGDGFGLTELEVVLEEMGAALLCSPFFGTVVLAAQALLAANDKAATLAVAESSGSWEPAGIATRAERTADGWALTGKKSFVIDGSIAGLVLVAAEAPAGPALFAVRSGAPGLRHEPMTALDPTRPMAALTFDQVPGELIGAEGEGGQLLNQVLDIACVALAAEQAGGARRCLEMSAEYARTRFQFGRAIGTFQAIKHKCADMLLEVESARSAAYYAAWAAADGSDELSLLASLAKAYCSDAFANAATENIQIHGGIGFTWEHDAHLYFKRAKASELFLGDGAYHRERLADRIGL